MAAVFVVCILVLQICPILVWRLRSLHQLRHAEIVIGIVSGWAFGTTVLVALAVGHA